MALLRVALSEFSQDVWFKKSIIMGLSSGDEILMICHECDTQTNGMAMAYNVQCITKTNYGMCTSATTVLSEI